MSSDHRDEHAEPRRGGGAGDEAYLRLVGERVRLFRVRRGLSRKSLSQISGVSERYLAELERGTGNASLLVLRSIAQALGVRVSDLAHEGQDRPLDATLAIHQLERLGPEEAAEARRMLVHRFGRASNPRTGRIALIGLRGAGKSTIGPALAEALAVPCVDLDREIEHASGMDIAEIFAMHGERVFRRLERDSLLAVIDTMPQAVLKTGGGIVLEKETFDLLLESCFVVWIKASPDEIYRRACDEMELEPGVIARRARQELEAALIERQPLYSRAHAILDTTNRNAEQVMRELLAAIDSEGHRGGSVNVDRNGHGPATSGAQAGGVMSAATLKRRMD